MFSQDLLNTFKEKITNAKNIAIFGHESVDGDAVGSMLGLGRICEKLGKNVGYYTTLAPSRSYSFLPGIEKIRTDFDYSDTRDLIIFVDFFEYKRIKNITEGREAYFDAKSMLIVDHHIGMNRPKNATILKDPESSSACELVYEICRQTFSDMLDSEIATFLYLGLLTDTGNFQYELDTLRTMKNAIGLIELGARKAWLIEYIFNNSDVTSIDLLKMMIPRITMHKNVCYVRYDIEEIEKLGFDKDEADILVFSNMKSIRNIAVFAVIRASKDNQVGISLRSGYMSAGQRINVQKIAIELGGGGHMYAAGCRQPREANFEAQVPKLVDMINTEIEKQL